MTIPKGDADRMRRLAREGKRISLIAREDFPQLNYWDVYGTIYGAGGRSALGVKRTIANKLKRLSAATAKAERDALIEEIDDLVWLLYQTLTRNQSKLEKMRKIIEGD